MSKKYFYYFLALILTFSVTDLSGQRNKKKDADKEEEKWPLQAFQFRNVGSSFLSGRIADIAINPHNESQWYVAVGSGGVWKTDNAGTTWAPIFDGESSYSTGCVTIDPHNPSVIWVGTGENVGGRHVGYGDGIYRSEDGGKSWKNMGLKESEHISKIIVHPDDTKTLWIAAQGPLWKKGGQRGLYKSTDGGKTYRRVLGNDQWTGVTDVIIDPRNPNTLYAATWDRHRTVAAYMGGGPGTGIHRSYDGGETWEELTNGLPQSNMGKMGLAISYQKPDVIYAAIELDKRSGGVFRSEDQGSTWKKMSNAVAGGTGPHYYQELYTSPHEFDRLYLMDVRIQTSEDGGKTFTQLPTENVHSDFHAIAFKKDDPDYILVGTDAGIYETFDGAKKWKYFKNMPLTQYYKVAVNDKKPFYHIFGGTQDNGSLGGPVATNEPQGISNKSWYKTLFADGHQSATDPEFNDIIYAETQQGGLHRIDLTTGEQIFVQPQAREGEPHERFNWDAPILVSPHKASRLYFGSYRVWKSENRGDSWDPISEDLTRNEERVTLPIMGRQQSIDNAWDLYAMSTYNTITSISESPQVEGLIYIGTDDGIIQVTEDGGENWRKIVVTELGLAERTFINDIKADLHDPNTVYVVLDNHKEGDLEPYIFKSEDRGKTWKSIKSNLPKRTLLWRVVQDHVDPQLFFLATEFGVYTSLNGGERWQKLPGTPTISFRDIVIQKRENDVVAASFGRNFFVLDDYSALRGFTEENLSKKGKLFKPRPAKWFVPISIAGNTGGDYYWDKNPEYGAVFTVHLSDEYHTLKQERTKREKELNKENKDVPFLGWEQLDQEKIEKGAQVILSIEDENGHIIRKVSKNPSKGSTRIAWDLRHNSMFPINENASGSQSWNASGPLVRPGTYVANLYISDNNEVTQLDGPIEFEVKRIYPGVLEGIHFEDYEAFRKRLANIVTTSETLEDALEIAESRIKQMKVAIGRTNLKPGSELHETLLSLEKKSNEFNRQLEGSATKNEIGEKNPATISNHISVAFRGMRVTHGPTELHKQSLSIAESLIGKVKESIEQFVNQEVPALEEALKEAGAPYLRGQGLD